MKTAKFVKELSKGGLTGAVWKIYELSEPLSGYSRVVVSAASVPYSGPETYIFGADGDDVADWGELDGSYNGGMDHEVALENAGYEVMNAGK